jgi:hypothetical protein
VIAFVTYYVTNEILVRGRTGRAIEGRREWWPEIAGGGVVGFVT